MLLVDNLGLPIESSGNLDKSHSGLISSIMKNAAKLDTILSKNPVAPSQTESQADCMAKIFFKNEQLVIRSKQGMTLALRIEGGI